ncbi:EEF1A lysine methyltransferase 2 [Pieris napi]|uniref:EEF1A lysine methyltransferase 2 n=1 Tax=Pieris napi TaxID=78633 RepID=UPI001FB8F7AC|nr:EEF1A lysine methyltransferase 2 [Pieris napi]XP_047522423.1 EEF1A lysine methyltransferase 2 [Pieris napi]XP_047522424.1 EEF1A lysine methyltransferase 2 [Pieris napi]
MEDELNSSELGSQTYWQDTYVKELDNYEQSGDIGDVWFGEDSALRVIKWICGCGLEKDSPIIDLGCGNGFTLSSLADEGFSNLLGVDYCEEAIALAEKVNKEYTILKFKIFDIINDDAALLGKFGVVHDKGTYDAICLNPNVKEYRPKYIQQVVDMLNDNGLFVITSCNWTESELIKQFSEKLKLKCVIPTPQFKFGGKVGSVVSSVVFEKIIKT